MKNGRRKFLKIAGISALTIGSAPGIISAASSDDKNQPQFLKNKDALSAKRWGMVIDTRKINEKINEKIIHACNKTHNVPKLENKKHEIKWIWGEEYKHAFPSREHEFLNKRVKELEFPVLCNHCENPPCVRACPTKSTFKRDDGIVLMDFHRCIGCRFCMAACPYGSRSFNFRDPRPFIKEQNNKFPTRMKGVVEKCNFCAERLAAGKEPACVIVSEGAIIFGDIENEDSKIRKVLKSNYTIRRKPGLGTGPSVFYIV
jgi:Fe-S-cluster-containing dehydrogenase component